ncbi:uncharacterized protein LOC127837561 [Dreissena polymorpha]|uniref:Uncharacterized protein n=1 Tax=Dreissena polymorpha TaxID=45954 RepID=A0A9D4FNW6_DREPO|nr:uncharacterized protein LOC127837561 [Dreissena polymorpha]KAH3799830.1 hypothetical protein DPMN_153446 [Dreissena polymorpha]
MSLFCVQTHDLSWQDRTVNIELMISPARSQLLYNKHKGLKTKYEQVESNLEREKESYLRSYKTDQRLMERQKEQYSKRRNTIILRRAVAERRRSSFGGRSSAPARLEADFLGSSEMRPTFVTEINLRESKSADPRMTVPSRNPELTTLLPRLTADTPDFRNLSPCIMNTSPSAGKPFLERKKSVRFERLTSGCRRGAKIDENTQIEEDSSVLPIEDRIKRFLKSQGDFNKRVPEKINLVDSKKLQPIINRSLNGTLSVNLGKLENAFDEFCVDESDEGLHRMVRYAARLKANVRNAQNSSIMPRRASVFAM